MGLHGWSYCSQTNLRWRWLPYCTTGKFCISAKHLGPKFGILGILRGTAPKGDKTVQEPICTIVQNFMQIGVIIAEISYGKQKNTKQI